MMNKSAFPCAVTLLLVSGPALAYIGPGMSGGVIAAVLGIIGSIFLALFGVLYYPIKRLIRKNRKQKSTNDETKGKKTEDPEPSDN